MDDESGFEESLVSDIEAALSNCRDRPGQPGGEADEPAAADDGADGRTAADGTGGNAAAAKEAAAAKDAGPTPAKDGKTPPWLGKVLGHFRLMRLIGQGAMGFVVQAFDINLERMVALKILRRRVKGLEQRQKVEQFFREARAVAKIDHPNVVHVYEISQHKGWWYIAMEMIEGENLKKIVRAAGPLPASQACPIVSDAATALAVAHEVGIIHRDVKPSNLMITRAGRCKLTDFGFVRVLDPNDSSDFTDLTVGTPQFMAPEVIRRREITPAVDVYSLGATLYFALAGRAPYTGKTIAEICQKHLDEPPPDIRQVRPDLPESLALLIRRAMAKDPARRCTAEELAAALHAEAVHHRPAGPGGSAVAASTVAASSSLVAHPVGDEKGSTIRMGPIVPARRRLARRLRVRLLAGLGGLVALAVIAGVVWHVFGGNFAIFQSAIPPDPNRLLERFPNAPATYGVLPPGEIPRFRPPKPPPFSWVGKIDTAGIRFVASRR
ncbi:MAG: serine/threonine protein kinase, partial [Planctomycetes bacterium]|nr:serine/threonine protein kinase [Planctomycetota bacterium]